MPRLQFNQEQQKSIGTPRTTPHGAEWLDRRSEVINEALAEEVRRGEQRKNRSDSATAAVPETEPAAPESREDPIEPEVNPKRRLLMKSASLAASGCGQRKEKRSIPDDMVFRARKIRRLEPQDRWDAEAISNVIGEPWRMTDGKWTVDRPAVRVDPIPIPSLPFEGARVQSIAVSNNRAQAHSAGCRKRIEERLRTTPRGAERDWTEKMK